MKPVNMQRFHFARLLLLISFSSFATNAAADFVVTGPGHYYREDTECVVMVDPTATDDWVNGDIFPPGVGGYVFTQLNLSKPELKMSQYVPGSVAYWPAPGQQQLWAYSPIYGWKLKFSVDNNQTASFKQAWLDAPFHHITYPARPWVLYPDGCNNFPSSDEEINPIIDTGNPGCNQVSLD